MPNEVERTKYQLKVTIEETENLLKPASSFHQQSSLKRCSLVMSECAQEIEDHREAARTTA